MTDGLRLRIAYACARPFAWFVFNVVGLRRRVIRENLERAFPELAPAARRDIAREFVRRQGEFLAEALTMGRLTADEMRTRVTIANPGVLTQAAPRKPLILVGAHHGNPEWLLQRMALEFGPALMGLYKPVRTKWADEWLRKARTRFGSRLVPAKNVLQELARSRDVLAVGLIADQVPRSSPERHWTTFLGQPTAFYMGPELLGRAMRTPVVFLRMERRSRGHYEVVLEPLSEAGEKPAAGEITERYALALERWIRDEPAGWWWLHQRWKLKREPSAD